MFERVKIIRVVITKEPPTVQFLLRSVRPWPMFPETLFIVIAVISIISAIANPEGRSAFRCAHTIAFILSALALVVYNWRGTHCRIFGRIEFSPDPRSSTSKKKRYRIYKGERLVEEGGYDEQSFVFSREEVLGEPWIGFYDQVGRGFSPGTHLKFRRDIEESILHSNFAWPTGERLRINPVNEIDPNKTSFGFYLEIFETLKLDGLAVKNFPGFVNQKNCDEKIRAKMLEAFNAARGRRRY